MEKNEKPIKYFLNPSIVMISKMDTDIIIPSFNGKIVLEKNQIFCTDLHKNEPIILNDIEMILKEQKAIGSIQAKVIDLEKKAKVSY